MTTMDNITRKTSVTEVELAAYRARVVEMYRERIGAIDKFTCDDCGARFTCLLVFDAYNTDGDCIAEK